MHIRTTTWSQWCSQSMYKWFLENLFFFPSSWKVCHKQYVSDFLLHLRNLEDKAMCSMIFLNTYLFFIYYIEENMLITARDNFKKNLEWYRWSTPPSLVYPSLSHFSTESFTYWKSPQAWENWMVSHRGTLFVGVVTMIIVTLGQTENLPFRL